MSDAERRDEPLFTVVGGEPTAEELAALTVALLALRTPSTPDRHCLAGRTTWSDQGYRAPGAWAHR
ncbi:acyl-CoA carboxylase epsilon subunit [Saccharothrix isguenensis]